VGRVFRLGEDLVAALAGIAGPRDAHVAAEQGEIVLLEELQPAHVAAGVLGENVHRLRALQGHDLDFVVPFQLDVLALGDLGDAVAAAAGADHPAEPVVGVAEDDAVVGDRALVGQHHRIGAPARLQLGDIAGDGPVEDFTRVGPGDPELAERGQVIEPRRLADCVVLLLDRLAGIGPGDREAIPFRHGGAKLAMLVTEGGNTLCHS